MFCNYQILWFWISLKYIEFWNCEILKLRDYETDKFKYWGTKKLWDMRLWYSVQRMCGPEAMRPRGRRFWEPEAVRAGVSESVRAPEENRKRKKNIKEKRKRREEMRWERKEIIIWNWKWKPDDVRAWARSAGARPGHFGPGRAPKSWKSWKNWKKTKKTL